MFNKRVWTTNKFSVIAPFCYSPLVACQSLIVLKLARSRSHLLLIAKLTGYTNHWLHKSLVTRYIWDVQCVKCVRIWSYSGPYFPAFGQNTDQNNSE